MPAAKKVIVTFPERDDKKSVVRFNSEDDAAVSSIYIANDAVKKLGDPAKIKITIEPA